MNVHHLNVKFMFGNKVHLIIKIVFIESDSRLLNLCCNKVQENLRSSKQDFSFRSAIFIFTESLGRHKTLQDVIAHAGKIKGFNLARKIDLLCSVEFIMPSQIDLVKSFTMAFVTAETTVNAALRNNHQIHRINSPSTTLKWITF